VAPHIYRPPRYLVKYLLKRRYTTSTTTGLSFKGYVMAISRDQDGQPTSIPDQGICFDKDGQPWDKDDPSSRHKK
jgi:hypothetical protein